ncbi:MAG: hypothetical protein F4X00_01715 [Gemmatimonadetes bacterium]|nr:hypothetical protein [Gemmatimonadota bacterium]
MNSKDVVTIAGFAKEVGHDISSRHRVGFDEGRESAYEAGRVAGRESAIHALTAARFGLEAADHVVKTTRSMLYEPEPFGSIGNAGRIGICVLTCSTAEELLARVREVKEEEAKRDRELAPSLVAKGTSVDPRGPELEADPSKT